MSLEELIPPEVVNDHFYFTLFETAKRTDLKTLLEIGSSSGEGSTRALVTGILNRPSQDAQLFCMELSRTRFAKLVDSYRKHEFVIPYNVSSVSLRDFPTIEEVIAFYNSTATNLNNYDLSRVIGWLRQDIEYITQKRLDFCGIEFVKSCNRINKFDFVLIDGSEFTGEAELNCVWGAKVIALDDVNTHKCFAAYTRLLQHHLYRLVTRDLSLRNGFAIFERIC